MNTDLTLFVGIGAITTIVIWIWQWWSKIKILKNKDFETYNTKLKRFEHNLNHYYPYDVGREFCINHGKKYMAFFERMGMPFVVAYVGGDCRRDIVGTGIGVLRTNNVPFPTWYICDLKIAKEWRGSYIPFKMLVKSLVAERLQNYTTRCYAITMNPADKVIRLATRIWTPYGQFKNAGNLLIYSVSADDMRRVAPIIMHHKGSVGYVSLMGIKDLLVRTIETKEQLPLKLMHVNHHNVDSNATIVNDIDPETTYMFCFHEEDLICKDLKDIGITTKVSATILQLGMDSLLPTQWDFIQTSEI